jgi:transposase
MRQREAQLKEEIARLVERAEAQDTAEDQEYGVDSDGYSVTEELARREARLAKIRAAREHLEAEQRADQGLPASEQPVIGDQEQRSFADDDARIMLMKRGAYDYAYNAQAVVDAESGVIVAAVLTNIAADMRHLPDLVAEVRTLRDGVGLLDDHPTTVSADAGYFSGENADEDGAGLDLLIAAGRDDPAAATTKAAVYAVDRFGYDPTRDVWICPADKVLHLVPPTGRPGRVSMHQYVAAVVDCADCPLRAHCLKPDEDHRLLQAKDRRSAGAMRFKLRQPHARRRYARRKTIVEPVFGQLKEARGFATLSLRGLARAAGEYLLACLAHNLGKLLRVCPLPAARLTLAAA